MKRRLKKASSLRKDPKPSFSFGTRDNPLRVNAENLEYVLCNLSAAIPDEAFEDNMPTADEFFEQKEKQS